MAVPCKTKPQLLSNFKDCSVENFDYIVIGSSFCGFGFVYQLLQNNFAAKILVIEKGPYPDFQDLSPEDLGKNEKDTEVVPWRFVTDDKSSVIKDVRGINCFIGGRSCFWKAWCPKPTVAEMYDWPPQVIDNVLNYFSKAESLLEVKPVHKIKGNLFDRLQDVIHRRLLSYCIDSELITRAIHAPLAVIEKTSRFGNHQRYSVVDPLLEKVEQAEGLKLLADCDVRRILTTADNKPFGLDTSQGEIPLGQAKLILAMSTLPSTSLMLESFSHIPRIGKRFTAHFASYIFARVPCVGEYAQFASKHEQADDEQPEMAALYIAGGKNNEQFHIQLNAVVTEKASPNLDKMRHLLKTPKFEMVKLCNNHIVFVCASLGQVDHNNPKNRFYLEAGKPVLNFIANDKDKKLWKIMDDTTFEVLEHLSPSSEIEYWDSELKEWKKEHPPEHQIQHRSLVHPASTMWIDGTGASPVDLNYKFHGVENVYLTGGALWPTGASWNPTCAMTALAMHLADTLCDQQPASTSTEKHDTNNTPCLMSHM